VKKFLLILLAITIYFNIGFAVATWYERADNTNVHEFTALQSFSVGPGLWMVRSSSGKSNIASSSNTFFLSCLLWPLLVVIVLASWTWWFVFFGGAFKLIGLL
jgi:hypothetical protein